MGQQAWIIQYNTPSVSDLSKAACYHSLPPVAMLVGYCELALASFLPLSRVDESTQSTSLCIMQTLFQGSLGVLCNEDCCFQQQFFNYWAEQKRLCSMYDLWLKHMYCHISTLPVLFWDVSCCVCCISLRIRPCKQTFPLLADSLILPSAPHRTCIWQQPVAFAARLYHRPH